MSVTPSHEVKPFRLSSSVRPSFGEEMMTASTEVVVDLDDWKVDFTELPPQRLLCPTCSRVFRNPHSTNCCKQTYCFECIENGKGGKCPSCRGSDLEIVRDESTQQSINELYVRCIHVTNGCMWFGKLEFLRKHLDLNMKESQGGCVFVTVPCPNDCGGRYTKKTLQDHLIGRCIKRKYDCEFCGQHSGIYETFATQHFPICPQYPVACPNFCPQKKVARCKLDFHLKNQCEHQDNVTCIMEFAGCKEKLLRKNMHAHIQKNLVEHMGMFGKMFASYKQSLSDKLESLPTTPITPFPQQNGSSEHVQEPSATVSNTKAINQDYEDRLKAKDIEIKQIKAEIRSLQSDKDEQSNSLLVVIDALRRSLELQEQRLEAAETLNHTFTKDISRLRLFLPSPLPLSYTINKFDLYKQTSKWWYSRPFYSHYCGYKFGMFVFSNGVLDGKGSYISIFLYLVRGEYDDELDWPFRGNITIQLLNQRSDRGHHQKVIKFTDESPPSVSSRVTNAEMAKEGNGPTQFIAHVDLSYNAEKDTEYLRDDSLKIRVSSIVVKGQGYTSNGRGTDTLPRRGSRVPMEKLSSVDSPMSPKFPTSPLSPVSVESEKRPVSPLIDNNEQEKISKESVDQEDKSQQLVESIKEEDKVVTIDL